MDSQSLLVILREQKEEKENYPFENWVERVEESFFEWDSRLAQVVTGVRRSGKSTLCHQALRKHGAEYGYVNFDDDRLYTLGTEDLNTVLSCVYQLYGTEIRYLFLDEIQNVAGWCLFVNRLLRQGLHIVLTGSNAKLLSGELATHLTGRYNEIKLYPFSYRELCASKDLETKHLTTKVSSDLAAAMQLYLQDGGLPELMQISNPVVRRNYVEGLMETIIRKDIAKRFNIRNTDSLRRIANHLINNICQLVNYETLATISGLRSNKTAQQYTQYLEQAFLIQKVQKFSFKSAERIRSEKCYVVDTGFIANRTNSLLGENTGWRLENAVCIELLRRHRSEAEDIYYYKPSSRGKEVDFVVCRQGQAVELVQVAYLIDDKKTYNREVDALSEAGRVLGCDRLTLVSFSESRSVEADGQRIEIRQAVEWFGEKVG